MFVFIDFSFFFLFFFFTAPYIKQCIRNDPKLHECLAAEINHLRPYLIQGNYCEHMLFECCRELLSSMRSTTDTFLIRCVYYLKQVCIEILDIVEMRVWYKNCVYDETSNNTAYVVGYIEYRLTSRR